MKELGAFKLLATRWKLAVFVPCTLFAAFAWTHGGGHPIRYVAETGTDDGVCEKTDTPCKTIAYAVDQSQKGDEIRVAAGRYVVEELDVFYLLSDMVKIFGGYTVEGKYSQRDPDKNLTVIEGIPAAYREQLSSRGFRLLQDRKGAENELGAKEKQWLDLYKSLTNKPEGPTECVNGMAGNNECHNIDRVSHMPLNEFSSRPSSANDIWGFVDLNNDREYALIGVSNGTVIVDVTDAENPSEVGWIRGATTTWRDVKVYQYHDGTEYKAYAYVSSEAVQGLQIIDLNDLPNSVNELTSITSDFRTAHNVYIANVDYASGLALEGMSPYLYVAGSDRSGGVFLTYDLASPESPALIAQGDQGYIHDGTSLVITDARTASCAGAVNPCELFVDFNENTVDIWDMSNKNSPNIISSTPYQQSGYTHSGWWSSDKNTIFIQDELDEVDFGFNTRMRALDISNLDNPRIVGTFTGTTKAIDHNGFTLGDYYYMSNYRRGLTVIDVSDVRNMKEVAFFDTFAVPEANTANFNGAWGAYPYLPSGNILVSDIEYGLWVLRLNENDGELPQVEPEPSTPPSQGGGTSTSSGGGGGSSTAALILILFSLLLMRKRKF